MKGAEQIYERLVPVVEAINRTITIDQITAEGSGIYKLDTCSTLWATRGYTVVIGGNNYTITDLMPDEWIRVRGAQPIVATTFILYPFYFRHGKLLAVKGEIDGGNNTFSKYPMLWLHDITNETHNSDPRRRVGIQADCDFYALATANVEKLVKVTDHDRYAIRPMRNLLKAFLLALDASHITLMNTGEDARYYEQQFRDDARFGLYFNSNNNSQGGGKFFGDDTSGTHLKINIPFKRNACGPQGTCIQAQAFGGVDIYINGAFSHHQPANTPYDFITP